MGTPVHGEYQTFEEKVRRTVYIDNLSPQVTLPVLKMALGQFGTVSHAQFIQNYLEQKNVAQCALVEMEDVKQAKYVITEMTAYPFMISGMPRPVRARAAEPEMFADRPVRPGRKITCRWLSPKDPDFETAKELKILTRKHNAEVAFLLMHQLEEEEKLAKQQEEVLKGQYKKYELLDTITSDGSIKRVARHYNVVLADD